MTTTPENIVRQNIYDFLARLFLHEITDDFVQEVNSAQGQDFLTGLASIQSMSEVVMALKKRFKLLGNEKSQLELAADYCALFILENRLEVSPYASYYLSDKEKLLFGEYHHKMTEMLKKRKLTLNSEFKEPADHIGVIISYLAWLIKSDTPSDEQAAFASAYLLSWLPKLSAGLQNYQGSTFYQHCAQFLLHWLEFDLGSVD